MWREVATQGGVWWILAVLLSLGPLPTLQWTGLPCVYEGSIHTDETWFGYLANITIMTTGRMRFQFSYPADMCCQNILFYLEDQMSVINARMNCWQKVALLRPEDDQILRLTPRFSWSGCHMISPNGVGIFTCQGGRSFAASTMGERPTTWYISVSNCGSLSGLELQYKIIIDGHIGDCRNGVVSTTTAVPTQSPLIHSTDIPGDEPQAVALTNKAVVDESCVLEGSLNYTGQWYGFLLSNVSLKQGGGFKFTFSYPYRMQVQNVILYTEQDKAKLRDEQTCWQREGIIPSGHVADQIIDLSFRSSWNGCVSKNTSKGLTLVCRGERRYEQPRTVYVAVSNCRSNKGLRLNFKLEIVGYSGRELCSAASAPLGLLLNSSILYVYLLSVTVILYMQHRVHTTLVPTR